jgi:hypothetical protein
MAPIDRVMPFIKDSGSFHLLKRGGKKESGVHNRRQEKAD